MRAINQYIFNAEEVQQERIRELGNKLEKLNKLIDWEMFRSIIEKKLNRNKDARKGGRPPMDAILMFKIIILQALNGDLSDESMEYMITVRLDWLEFLGLVLGEKVPDKNTIWTFKENLGTDTMQELMRIFNQMLLEKGVITCKGTIVDATFNDVPRRRATTREENQSLKSGEIPDSLKKIECPQTPEEMAHNHKISQIDTDAAWAEKGKEQHFGYKGNAAVDVESKIVTDVVVTPANVHDVRVYVHMVCLAFTFYMTGAPVELLVSYADSGYTGEKYHDMLVGMFKGACIHVIRKATKGQSLKGWEKSYNRSVAKIRCRVEHVFGAITNDMGGIRTNSIGMERNSRDIVIKFLAYNIKRAAFLLGTANRTTAC